MTKVAFTLNGAAVEAEVEPRTSLADFLRGTQHLTATHLGCEHGVCGACTIVVNSVPARSCILFAASLAGADVRTLEGFSDDPLMSSVRDAFHREHALQCGFCTPGMLITSRDIASRFEVADEKRIRTELAGNLCRCTGYVGIVKAVQRVMHEVPAGQRLCKANCRSALEALPAASLPALASPAPAAAALSQANAAPNRAAGASRPVPQAAVAVAPAEKGSNRVDSHFVVARPREQVWAMFADTAGMAQCLPGFELGSVDGNDISGRMRVAFGPIKASFACVASIERDDAALAGVLRGSGRDDRGGSRAKGQVTYRLAEEEAGKSTRVAVTLDYQLQGPLAQFSRSGLVRDFSNRLIAGFAQNLSVSLSGAAPRGGETAPAQVGAMLWATIRAYFTRRTGR